MEPKIMSKDVCQQFLDTAREYLLPAQPLTDGR